jgi:hypothetical protein
MSTDSYGNLRISQKKNIFNFISNDTIINNSKYVELNEFSSIDQYCLNKFKLFIYDSNYDTYIPEDIGQNLPVNSYFNQLGLLILNMKPNNSEQYITMESKNIIEYHSGCSRNTKFSFIPYFTWDGITIFDDYPIRSTDTTNTINIRYGLFNCLNNRSDPNFNKKIPTHGIYLNFALDNSQITTISWVLKYDTVTSSINQSSWNIDTFDGTGPSGKTINQASLNKKVTAIIDENHMDGRIRVGFIIDGITYYAHIFNYNDLNIFPLMYNFAGSSNMFIPNLNFNYQMYKSGVIKNESENDLNIFTGLYNVNSSLELITDIIKKDTQVIYLNKTLPSSDTTEYILLSARYNKGGFHLSNLNIDINSISLHITNPTYQTSPISLEITIQLFIENQVLPNTKIRYGELNLPVAYSDLETYNNTHYNNNNNNLNSNLLEYWSFDGVYSTDTEYPTILSEGKVIKNIFIGGVGQENQNFNFENGLLGDYKISKDDTLIITAKAKTLADTTSSIDITASIEFFAV